MHITRVLIFWGITVKDIITMVYLYIATSYSTLAIGGLFVTPESFLAISLLILGFSIFKYFWVGIEKMNLGLYLPMLLFVYLSISTLLAAINIDSLSLQQIGRIIGQTNAWMLSIYLRAIIIYVSRR